MLYLDLGATNAPLRREIAAAMLRVLDSGHHIGGPEVEAFETAFAAFCGTRHCIGTGNGLDALRLILMARGIGPGDEVIVPAATFIASWSAVALCGARVVPVDAEPQSMSIDPALVEAAITPATRALIAVHLHGTPAPMQALRALADQYGLMLIEDAAQAHGAQLKGRSCGAMGDAAAFSFYPAKNLGAIGDGGCVTTDDAGLAARIRALRDHGATQKHQHAHLGLNSRLDPLQAAVLAIKLPHLGGWHAHRRQIADLYDQGLAGLHELTLPCMPPDSLPARHLYVIRHPRRDALATALAAHAIPTALHYPVPIHRSGAFLASHGQLSLPVSEAISATCLSLPIGPHLSSQDAARVIAACQAVLPLI